MKKKILLSSILTIALCLSIIAGSTYALFTSSADVNVAVTAGNVELTAALKNDLKTWSLNQTEADAVDGAFVNGGSAYLDNGTLVLDRMTPGDVVKATIDVVNASNVKIEYRVRANAALVVLDETAGTYYTDLTPVLKIVATVNGVDYVLSKGDLTDNAGDAIVSDSIFVDANGEIGDVDLYVEFVNHDFDGSIDNDYRNAKANLTFTIEAVQFNGANS